MLEKIKLLLNIADATKDSLLQVLIDDAKVFATDYCNLLTYDIKLDGVVIKMVLEDYNKLGNQGITSKNYSGISESYTDDYSLSIYKQLNKHRKIKML